VSDGLRRRSPPASARSAVVSGGAVGEEEGATLGALLPSESRGPDEEVEIALREHALRTALERLPEREREVVRLRYGIDGEDPTPLRETGRRLGMSSDAVRRLERKALAESR
jgi:RNA polymerase primary sigma factor